MSRILYVLHPGPVMSKYDGERHYIGAAMLARLYGVPMSMCVICDGQPGFRSPPGAKHLHPRGDGNYTLEKRP